MPRKREEMPFVRQGKLHNPQGEPICAVATAEKKTGWLDWLKGHKSFRYESLVGVEMSVLKEVRQGRSGEYFDYWYAHRHVFGQLVRVYLGKAERVTSLTLEEAAGRLAQLELGGVFGLKETGRSIVRQTEEPAKQIKTRRPRGWRV